MLLDIFLSPQAKKFKLLLSDDIFSKNPNISYQYLEKLCDEQNTILSDLSTYINLVIKQIYKKSQYKTTSRLLVPIAELISKNTNNIIKSNRKAVVRILKYTIAVDSNPDLYSPFINTCHKTANEYELLRHLLEYICLYKENSYANTFFPDQNKKNINENHLKIFSYICENPIAYNFAKTDPYFIKLTQRQPYCAVFEKKLISQNIFTNPTLTKPKLKI